MTTTTGGVRCHNPDACCAGQKPCPSPGACGVEADALELADALDNVARNVVSDRATIQQAAEALRRQHAALQPGYSIDADPQGIRALVADAISGALAFGAQGSNPPPEGHWLAPFWNVALAAAPAAVSAPSVSEDATRLDFIGMHRVALIPEFEGGWDAQVYEEDGEPSVIVGGTTVRAAIDAAMAAAPQAPAGDEGEA